MDAAESTLTDPTSGRPAFLRGWRLWAYVGGAFLLVLSFVFRGGKKAAVPSARLRVR